MQDEVKVTQADVTALVEAIDEAGRGYSINLTRLVDGVSTYELHYRGKVSEHECTDDAYAALREMALADKVAAATDFLARHRAEVERDTLGRMEPVAWMYSYPGAFPNISLTRAPYSTTWTEHALGIIPAPEAGQ